MTDFMFFTLIIFGMILLWFTLSYKMPLTAIISIPLWFYLSITAFHPLLLVVFISLTLINGYLTLKILMD